MKHGRRRCQYQVAWMGGAVALMAACGTPAGGPGNVTSWLPDAGAPGDATVGVLPVGVCKPVRASEDLQARIEVAVGTTPSSSAATSGEEVHIADLFDRFNVVCGSCHVNAGNGGKQTGPSTFARDVDWDWLAALESDDPKTTMPPGAPPFSQRPAGDASRQLGAYLEAWLSQGRPSDSFLFDDPNAGPAKVSGSLGYVYSAMTNLGDCVPDKDLFASSPSTEMQAKDQFFAEAAALPTDLGDTDLTTLNSDVLAMNGVIAYLPTYPLWSDGSGKLRHIRLPKGTHIEFDKQKQTFTIPPYTRFYKTFFREIVDASGHVSHRKIETRVIVAKPDTLEADGITPHPNALFGTYLWSEDEMTAKLHDAPYRDGTPFADKTIEYVTDEGAYRDLLAGLSTGAEATFPTRRDKALAAHPELVQHYAVPGSIRCVQCHRGSPTQDFILGMNPLQLAQRPYPAGGTYEPSGEDQLTQVQRFIDLGLITGMTSPEDIVPLEESQAPRHARTPEELTAQAYMIGNCAHCHNTRGFPSLVKPELAKALNLMPAPGPEGGGIFEFSLENKSPLRLRGANGDVPFPYITPSLRDYPVADPIGVRLDNGNSLGSVAGGQLNTEVTWTPKYDPNLEFYDQGLIGCARPEAPASSYCRGRSVGRSFVAAPWRSLVYRNVDTPFPYFDDYVPFPHMPMNTAGFDCRAPRIMGDWMVSLPAERTNLRVSEDALPADAARGHDGTFDDSWQPYREVKPGSPGYDEAVARAKSRLAEYHAGIRYNYCQDVLGADIFDPVGTTTKVAKPLLPAPDRYVRDGIPPRDPENPRYDAQPAIGVPYHAHWYNFDPTDDPPPWAPRRSQWESILVEGKADDGIVVGQDKVSDADAASRALVRQALNEVAITDDLVRYAKTEIPYGLWQVKPECQARLAAADIRPVSAFTGPTTKVPAWISDSTPDPTAPVFMASPGAMLYRNICFNCHGPKADGKGLQADLLSASSDGEARPANFVAGLFGPVASPGQNLVNVFGGPDKDVALARVWGSRYMAWMALGGTLQRIPTDIIHLVEATPILGQSRPNRDAIGNLGASANMLNLAKALCGVVLPDPSTLGPSINDGLDQFRILNAPQNGYPPRNGRAPFVRQNGDWEMWMNLCSRFTPQVIRVYGLRSRLVDDSPIWDGYLKALYLADPPAGFVAFPEGAPVLDHKKETQPFVRRVAGGPDVPDNFYPACVQRPGDVMPGEVGAEVPPPDKWDQFKAVSKLPDCPSDFLAGGQPFWRRYYVSGQDPAELANVTRWTLKGAATAGMAVFSYLQAADLGHHTIAPYFNECQLLAPAQ